MKNNERTNCDRKGCKNAAVWTYTITTLYGVEDWNSCQDHVREIREMHGMNIQEVRKVR